MKITSIPVLTDNYIHVIEDLDHNTAIIVDPAESEPVLNYLRSKNTTITHILLTHHHGDHIGGVAGLKQAHPRCEVIGHKADRHRLPPMTKEVSDGDVVTTGKLQFNVWHLPGHTTGHIAFICESEPIAFTGDVLFGMGCGRLFEGTYEEMYTSLSRLKTLSPETKIYCTHEYTLLNAHFASSELPDNKNISDRLKTVKAARDKGLPTVPLTLNDELKTNPFLLANSVATFSEHRKARDTFKM